MLPHYSPFKVAETFSAARRAVPRPHRPRHRPRGRHRPDDDVRAPARPPHRRRPTTSPSSSPSCSRTTTAASPPTTRSRGSGARCRAARSSRRSGCSAPRRRARSGPAQLGLPYAFADFINPDGAADRGAVPRGLRAVASGSRTPRVAVAVWAICADTDEEAQRLAASGRMTFTLLRQGRLIPVPPPEKALRFLAQQDPTRSPPPRRHRLARDRARRASRRSPRATAPRR